MARRVKMMFAAKRSGPDGPITPVRTNAPILTWIPSPWGGRYLGRPSGATEVLGSCARTGDCDVDERRAIVLVYSARRADRIPAEGPGDGVADRRGVLRYQHEGRSRVYGEVAAPNADTTNQASFTSEAVLE